MVDDVSRTRASAEISAIDALYRGLPDFAAWGRLGPALRELWERFSAELIESSEGKGKEQFDRAVNVAVRAAAMDTGALEGLYEVDRGFTMSVALQAFAWQQALAERGEEVRALFEAHLAGYEMAIDAVTGQTPPSEAWLRVLHERLCAPQETYRVLTEVGWQEQPLPKGRYKEHPNHVKLPDGSYHPYAPVAATAPEMQRLLEQLRTEAFEQAHPAEQAAYAHYALTVVHPFADGNGRVARALASVYLYRGLSIPLVVFANQRVAYLDALAQADRGNHGPWLEFVADRGIDTMQLIVETMRSAAVPQADEIAERLASLLSSRGRTYAELDNLARRLLEEVQARWGREVGKMRPQLVDVEFRSGERTQPAPPSYRLIGGPNPPVYTVILGIPPPAALKVPLNFRVTIALDDANPFGFRLEALESQDYLDIREADVAPELSESLKLRMDAWIRRHLAAVLRQLEEKAKDALKASR
ncbi:MAG TPA: Fic family protein [Thermoanaerobaculia bacterium]|nr:Fic family protein [Thermoanaerobaculia bacterium]